MSGARKAESKDKQVDQLSTFGKETEEHLFGKDLSPENKAFAIEVKNLSKHFGERRVLDNLEFTLPKGAFLSIFGPNGAGKSVLLSILASLSKPSEGELFLNGINAFKEPEKARAIVGLVSHSSLLYPDLTAQENLEFFANLYGINNAREEADCALERVGLKQRRYDMVRDFSCGMTQRLSIARALIGNPQILLLDEPYSGLDPKATKVLDSILQQEKENRTIVMVSHDLEKGLALCSHALILAKRKIAFFEERDCIDASGFTDIYYEACLGGAIKNEAR